MSTAEYLKRKYRFDADATVPIEFLAEETHLTLQELKPIIRRHMNKKHCPGNIRFDAFTKICTDLIA